MIEKLLYFLKGMVIGIANVIPGVSGGTIALTLNIYEELINAIKSISFNTLMVFVRLLSFKKERVIEFKEEMKKINIWLLVFVIGGAGLAILIFSNIMNYLIVNFQSQTFGFFFGLILISIVVPYKLIKKKSIKVYIAIAMAIVVIVGLTIMDTDQKKIESEEYKITIESANEYTSEYEIKDYVLLAVAGAVGMATMILPGVSGAFILLLMGQYFFILEVVSDFNIPLLAVFAIGALCGLLLFSRLIDFLLNKFHDVTMGFLTGLVIGSLYAIWPFKGIHILSNSETVTLSNTLPSSFGSIEMITIITALAGAGIVILMLKLDKKKV